MRACRISACHSRSWALHLAQAPSRDPMTSVGHQARALTHWLPPCDLPGRVRRHGYLHCAGLIPARHQQFHRRTFHCLRRVGSPSTLSSRSVPTTFSPELLLTCLDSSDDANSSAQRGRHHPVLDPTGAAKPSGKGFAGRQYLARTQTTGGSLACFTKLKNLLVCRPSDQFPTHNFSTSLCCLAGSNGPGHDI